ncbi:flavin-containing monooxygenase [Whalleya microplaca]|nr:flavin-containing monooxygenase [Whalleya microplaca]
MDGTPLPSIPTLTLHSGINRDKIDAEKIVGTWLSQLQDLFIRNSFDNLSDLFIEDCWWRDILGLTWDFRSKYGQAEISKYLLSAACHFGNLQIIKLGGLKPIFLDIAGMMWIQSGFTFKNQHGEGRGLLKLANVDEHTWKAWTIFTQLESLDYQKELEARRMRNPAATARLNHSPSTNGHVSSNQENPQVLIVGAAQAGLALGARLEHLGLRTLLIDKHPRLGDSWRTRYESLTLNTPTYTDHYPFLKLPGNWPRWLGKDQVANFLEHYGQLMGLDILLNTKLTKLGYDKSKQIYRVQVESQEGTKEFSPRHVVLATGSFSDEPIIPEFAGQESFKGEIYHSVEHRSARQVPDVRHKRVVVVGAGPSAHDIAQDFTSSGAKEVSMIQQHPIFSISVESMEALQLALWNMPELSTEDADLVGNAIPLSLIRTMSIGLTQAMAAFDKAMLDGLRAAGLAILTGEDGYGLADHQLIKGGRFYIDQGANQMIIDGRIKIHRCEEGIKEFTENGLTLADGKNLEADVVVLATGYHRNIRSVEQVLGREVTEKMPNFGLLDEEGERDGWWRPTGIPGFWYMTGSFMWSRQFSAPLALQIAAVEKGLNKTYF